MIEYSVNTPRNTIAGLLQEDDSPEKMEICHHC